MPILFSLAVMVINGMTFNTLLTWPIMVVFWLGAGLLRSIDETIERTGKTASLAKQFIAP